MQTNEEEVHAVAARFYAAEREHDYTAMLSCLDDMESLLDRLEVSSDFEQAEYASQCVVDMRTSCKQEGLIEDA